MDNKVIKEINSIGSLMNRMDNPVTVYEAMLNEKKDFSGRVRFDTVLDLLQNKYRNGWFMGMGYIKVLPLNKRVNVKDENRAKGREVLGIKDDEIFSSNKYKYNPDTSDKYEKMGDWRGNLDKLVNDPEWDNTITRGKQSFKRPDYIPEFLIVIETYRWHWEPREKYVGTEKEKYNGIKGIKSKYGFDNQDLTDDDWRIKYNAEEKEKKKKYRGSTYTDDRYADWNLFGDTNPDGTPRYDENGYQKLALKQHVSYNESLPLSMNYYQVNSDGTINRIPYQYANFLLNHTGSGPRKNSNSTIQDIADEIKTDEQKFREEITSFKGNFPLQYKQWIIDEMAYITATVENENGEKTQGYWINDRIDAGTANQDEVIRMISKEVNLSYDFVKLGELNSMM